MDRSRGFRGLGYTETRLSFEWNIDLIFHIAKPIHCVLTQSGGSYGETRMTIDIVLRYSWLL